MSSASLPVPLGLGLGLGLGSGLVRRATLPVPCFL